MGVGKFFKINKRGGDDYSVLESTQPILQAEKDCMRQLVCESYKAMWGSIPAKQGKKRV